jgi:hypothetical protein
LGAFARFMTLSSSQLAYAAFKEIVGHPSERQPVATAAPQHLTRSLLRGDFSVTDGDTIHING